MRTLSGSVLAILLISIPTTAYAQQVSGTVRAADGGLALSGAVVTAVDSSGRSIARTLTDRNGRYALSPPTAATQVRAIRIGYRPGTASIPRGSVADARLDIVMERLPVMLQTVRISSGATCGDSPDGVMVLQLWEQARAALLASIVAREAQPARVRLLTYVRRTDAPQKLISRQMVTVRSGQSTRPVAAARTAAQLAADGYRMRDGTDAMYLAPDADVLFDESFSSMHCFGVTSGTGARADAIGLTFSPRKTARREMVDVEGVLWIRRQIPELIQLEYQYTGVMSEASGAGNGGTMHFRTMSNGIVFIDSWSITIPILQLAVGNDFPGSRGPRFDVKEISETGGYVLDAVWPDGEHWNQPLGGVRGRVREAGTHSPVEGVSITVRGTASTESDSAGMYALLPLPPGRYELNLVDSAFSAFVKPRRQSRVVTLNHGDTVTSDFELPARTAVLVAAAGRQASKTNLLAQDFERRRQAGGEGNFIGEAELRRKDALSLASVLRELVPGVRFETHRGGQFLRSRTPTAMEDPLLDSRDISSPRGCWANIYLDGAWIYDGPPAPPPNINSFSTASLAAIEYYAGPASMPQQFKSSRNSCGTLLLWTR